MIRHQTRGFAMLRAAKSECSRCFDVNGNEDSIDLWGFEPTGIYDLIPTRYGLVRCQLFINSNDETDQVWV